MRRRHHVLVGYVTPPTRESLLLHKIEDISGFVCNLRTVRGFNLGASWRLMERENRNPQSLGEPPYQLPAETAKGDALVAHVRYTSMWRGDGHISY